MSAKPKLKLLVNQVKSPRSQPQPRLFIATIHRHSQHQEDRRRNLTRHYSCLDNAAVGCVRFMMAHGYAGDVCELFHEVTGMQLGTVKMNAKGKLVVNWVWE